MTLILFLHILFGLWFAYQTYKSKSKSALPNSFITSCVFFYLILLLLLAQTHIIGLILGIYLPIFTYILIEWLWVYRRSLLFHSYFMEMLDSIIARMKMGNSFRSALSLSISVVTLPWLKEIFKEIQDRIIFSQQLSGHPSKEVQFAFQTFQQADQDLQPISRLHYVRQALKVEDKFRKHSQKALLQIHLQSFILIGLYTALFVFSILYYGTQFLSIFLISSFLFVIGSLAVFLLGRKIKWTL